MLGQYVANRVWRAVRAVIVSRATGWIAAAVVAIAALLANRNPDWRREIEEVRDVVTNAIWSNETAITNAVGQLPENLNTTR